MSHSAPQSKMPSPARSPRPSVSLEEKERPHKPAGIINMGMTCFLNSTFQALCATPDLISLLRNNPAVPLYLAHNSILPASPVPPDTIPALLPATMEPPLYELLPVTRAFTNCLHKAWTTKDLAGGTSGAMEASSRHSYTLRSLLKEMARKYDQYDEFAQQDAHELLRHLLDSMQMEEKDVIKRVTQDRPLRVGSMSAANGVGNGGPGGGERAPPPPPLPPRPTLTPFVDVLFGGLLSSIVICETCKSVSHTYEGFLDISLSMRGDEDDAPKARKRDKFRSWLKPSRNGKDATMSEPEVSDSEKSKHRHRSQKQSGLGHGLPIPVPPVPTARDSDAESDGAVSLGRSASAKLSKAVRPSFSFRRKGQKADGAASSVESIAGSGTGSGSSPPAAAGTPASVGAVAGPPTPRASSPALSPPTVAEQIAEHNVHAAAPTPAQAAYIQRILYGPPAAPAETTDPLAKLRTAHTIGLNAANATQPSSQEYGLVDSLKSFMAVEVLEGDNAFACHKCWKIKNGRYHRHKSRGVGAMSSSVVSSSSLPSQPEVPSIEVLDLEAPNGTESTDKRGRFATNRGLVRTPSPLRQMVERPRGSVSFPSSEAPYAGLASESSGPESAAASIHRVETEEFAPLLDSASSTSSTSTASLARDECESDGLSEPSSDSELDDDPIPGAGKRPAFFRPALTRAQSRNRHYVLRRAFKRYLVAKAPEVLVFHIKRFKQVGGAGMYVSFSSLKKVDDFVSFPEVLDMAPFMAPNRNDFKVVNTPTGPRAPYQDWPSPDKCPDPAPMPYRLYAVVVHLGTMLSGHYIAYVLVDPERMFATPGDASAEHIAQLAIDPAPRKKATGTASDRRVWCYCSDTEVRLASVEEVLAAKAYLCFYEKV